MWSSGIPDRDDSSSSMVSTLYESFCQSRLNEHTAGAGSSISEQRDLRVVFRQRPGQRIQAPVRSCVDVHLAYLRMLLVGPQSSSKLIDHLVATWYDDYD